MKKNLLTLGSLAFSLSLSAQVLTYVGNDALMTVQDGALVYSGGGWANAGSGTVNNTGDIMVVAPASETNTKFEVGNTAAFVLKYADADTYGQLYINGVAQGNISGNVSKEYKADANHGYNPSTGNIGVGRQQLGLPFYNLSVADLKTNDFFSYLQTASNTLNSSGRFNYGSAFRWNNKQIRFDQLLDGALIGKATDYFIIPRRDASAIQWDAENVLKTFKGIPYSDVTHGTNTFTLDVLDRNYISDLGSGGNKKNIYAERYNSYLNDPFRNAAIASDWQTSGNYGKDLNQFANPFLTNLDLTNLKVVGAAALNNIKGIAYYGSQSLGWYYENQSGSGGCTGTVYTSGNIVMTVASGGSLQLGDLDDKFVIKPLGEVMVKLSTTDPVQVNLNDARSFSQTKRADSDYDVANRPTAIPADKIIKQVGVTLLSADGKEIGRTFYAVSPSAATGGADASLQGYVDNYPIYTKEEKAEGGEDTNYAGQLYINEANETNFRGKEIPMFINYEYPATLKFDIFEAGVKLQSGEALTAGDFYIKNGSDIVKINSGDTMVVNNNYYGLYFEQPEGTLGANNALAANTIIAKKENDWVVRFSKNWKTANVEVYSASGQLIHSKKNVITSQDYIIPLEAKVNAMFIVRATSDAGEVVTKKIVK